MIFVTKFDGRREPFRKEKVVRTCLRMHASPVQARSVADKVESKLYEGIRTNEILRMIFRYMKEYRPEIKHEIDLKEAISLLRPKPDFEQFVRLLLDAYGYQVEDAQLVNGKCVEHEIDGIARKGDETIYVEVKHHFNHHVYTGVGVFLEAHATFEDLTDGYKLKNNSINFTKAMIVCNTKFSDHAKKYAECMGINYIGWKAPEEKGLERMMEEKKLYPITFLKDLDRRTESKLGDAGIVLLRQLVEANLEKLHERTKISKNILKNLVRKAGEILK